MIEELGNPTANMKSIGTCSHFCYRFLFDDFYKLSNIQKTWYNRTDRKEHMESTVAIYCRTTKKNDSEIEKQKEVLVKLAKKLGYENHLEYIDNGYSHDDYERPPWKKMRKDAYKKFDMILVTDYSRIIKDINYIRQAQLLDDDSCIDIHCPKC